MLLIGWVCSVFVGWWNVKVMTKRYMKEKKINVKNENFEWKRIFFWQNITKKEKLKGKKNLTLNEIENVYISEKEK